VGLDPNQIADFRDLMIELSKSHTIIFSTHILSEIDLVCQKVVILDEGRLVAAGRMADLQHNKKGEDSFLLRVTCEKGKAEAALLKAAGKYGGFAGDAAEGFWFRVSAPKNLNLRKKVFFEFAKEGLAIEELKDARLSLEQVFLELTSRRKEKKI
jgi:ABC-2 type transport system ATP-binding protein